MPDWIPDGLGLKAVHQRPYVAGADKVIVGRRGVIEAWAEWHRIEVNPPHVYAALLFDVDNPSEEGWYGLVLPSWIVQNTFNGHMHLGYALETPVGRHDAAGMKPQRYAAHVADRLSLFLGADPGYRGLIHRNPVNPGPGCAVWQPEFWLRTHTLEGLNKAVPKSVEIPATPQTGVGRNCDLFNAMIKEVHRPRWADRLGAEAWRHSWLDHVRQQNELMFPGHTLPDFECRSIAKSCYRYWAKQYDPARFSARQTARIAKRWHGKCDYDFDARDASILSLAEVGFKQREIAELVELSKGQVSRRLKKLHTITVNHPVPAPAAPRPVQEWAVVTACVLCRPETLHRPGAVLCVACGRLSRDGKEEWRLPRRREQPDPRSLRRRKNPVDQNLLAVKYPRGPLPRSQSGSPGIGVGLFRVSDE